VTEPAGRRAVAAVLASALFAIALTACSGSSPTGAVGAPTATIVAPPLIAAPCAPSAGRPAVSAINLAFRPNCFGAPANTAVTLTFQNRDPGVQHNVAVFPGPRGYNTNPATLFRGAIITGRSTVAYSVPPLPAGLLTFHCDVHDFMVGLIGVKPSVSPSTGGVGSPFTIVWATPDDAPAGYVFDVQVRTPGTTGFKDWLTHQTALEATYTPGSSGTYSFRVSLYPASREVRPVGYSPPASIVVG
jgi:hypothetical protein